jgi:hypothetical protein
MVLHTATYFHENAEETYERNMVEQLVSKFPHFRQNNEPSPNEVFIHTFTAKNTAHKRWYCHDFE